MKYNLIGIMQSRHILANDLNWEAAQGFRQLGAKSTNALPELIKIYDKGVSISSVNSICDVFIMLGPKAKAAVPSLVREMNKLSGQQNSAINALRRIRSDPEIIVPLLTKSLNDPYFPPNRMDAAYALAAYGTNSIKALPVLTAMLTDPKNSTNKLGYQGKFIQNAVEYAIAHIDPNALTNSVNK